MSYVKKNFFTLNFFRISEYCSMKNTFVSVLSNPGIGYLYMILDSRISKANFIQDGLDPIKLIMYMKMVWFNFAQWTLNVASSSLMVTN